MLNPGLYIHSSGFIAPDEAQRETPERLSAREPDYAGIIPPMQLRRMSKGVRMGIGAAHACLQDAGLSVPDAIAVGTTMGCLQDTEVFLKKLVTQDERMLTPTSFIQSTHNTVAGQIALVTGCQGYNTTVSHRGHSFEGAVMNAALYLAEHPEHSALCGGVDELTDTSFTLMQRMGLLSTDLGGGEGAGFVLLKKISAGALCRITGLMMISATYAGDTVVEQISAAMAEAGGILPEDALWVGVSDEPSRQVYNQVIEGYAAAVFGFKQSTGEWGTAIAVAIAKIVRAWPAGRSRIWILNHYCNDWSLWLLER